MTASRQQISWGVWPLWASTMAAGNALAATAFIFIYSYDAFNALERSERLGLVAAIVPIVGAAMPCFVQWLMLRRWFVNAGWWIPASGLGGLLGFLPIYWAWAIAVANTQAPIALAINAAFLLAGAVTGAVEWLALRWWVSRAGWWVLGRSVSSLAAMWLFVILTMTREFDPSGDVKFIWSRLFLNGAASGALSGVITGFVLVWLLRNKVKQQAAIAGNPDN